jgi:hypothetical protein
VIRPLLAALALGLVLGGLAGWRLAPRPAPEIRTVERLVQGEAVERVREVLGPVRVETRTVTRTIPGPERPGPTRETVVTRIEERAGTVVEREGAVRVEERLRTVTVQAPPPVWAVGAGLQLLPDQRLEIALEHRLVGPVWVRAWALQPTALQPPAVGLGLRVEW